MKQFNKILDLYQSWLAATPLYSQYASDNYAQTAKNYLSYLENFNIYRLNDVNLDLLLKFIRFNNDREYAPSTVRLRLSALSLFYKWAYKNRYSPNNLIIEYKKSKLNSKASLLTKEDCETKEIEVLSPEEQGALIQLSISNNPLDIRNKCIVLLILASALYAEEIIKLPISALNLENGQLLVNTNEIRTRTVQIDLSLCKNALNNWLNQRNCWITQPNEFLFVTKEGKPLTKRMLHHIVSRYLKDACVNKKHLGPELLRQTAICNMICKGWGLEEVSQNTGVQTLERFEKYKQVSR